MQPKNITKAGPLSMSDMYDTFHYLSPNRNFTDMVNSDTMVESFYEGIMNPIQYISPSYVIDGSSINEGKEEKPGTYDDVQFNGRGMQPFIGNEQDISKMPDRIKDARSVSNLYRGMYSYNDRCPTYEIAELEHPDNGRFSYAQQNGSGGLIYSQSVINVGVPDPSISSSLNNEQKGAKMSFSYTTGSTPSIGSESSPIAQSENVCNPKAANEYFSLDQLCASSNNRDTEVENAARRNYNTPAYTYDMPSRPIDDTYNNAFTETVTDQEFKSPEFWYNNWRNKTYSEYVVNQGYNVVPENMMLETPALHGNSYGITQNPYSANIIYGINSGITKAYVYEPDLRIGYAFPPNETGYYNSKLEYSRMNASDALDSTIHDISTISEDPLSQQQTSQVQQGYNGTYTQPSHQDTFYNASQSLSPGKNIELQEPPYSEDGLEISLENKDGVTSRISIDSLKNMNRNEIDFLRMSDSLWQTLRSTGMFKLGNKGRAILKSKISKQLKMNPKLRMRALCISGVRRATTRQLFQLAQICGIKSHLK
ncbi:hypothetical protein BgAZ_401400 [Babesia gibsoni]|uniref:Uncharacterized protein n=1 Tax=Babesia gibsoni TaxID=33632 RepID=A0AAD8P812_BABGI|nr:hypothetical protein BgAZ_401400 [Babesia gibsoni]